MCINENADEKSVGRKGERLGKFNSFLEFLAFKLYFKTAKIDFTYYIFWYVITSLLGSKTLKFLRCGNLNENTEGGRKIFSG